MHHSTPSHSNGGGLFKGGNIFGGNKTATSNTRPRTSSGSPSAHSESIFTSTNSRTSTFSRKTSFSSSAKSTKAASYRSRNNSAIPQFPPERRANHTSTPHTDNTPLPAAAAVPIRQDIDLGPKDADSFKQAVASAEAAKTLVSGRESFSSTTPYANMLARPGTGYQSIASTTNGAGNFAPMQPPSPTLETITFQHIQETSSKRISTLDYLRKAHEGRVYWFNTLLFNKPDLQKMPYFDSRKLARRATNYLLLGLSLPTIIDLNSSTAIEFLRTLNALLVEFESFQQIHPPDGSSSSLSRGRFPQMFKRAATATSKGRRTSSAAEIGLPMGNDSFDSKSMNGNGSSGGGTATAFAVNETDLLPGEEYIHLLTPSLPFDPDFYETFATLCDVFIDCYTRLMSLVSTPRECTPTVAELFTKADSRVRKIIVQGVVKEFEDSSKAGVRSEIAGVGRVVLGGLM